MATKLDLSVVSPIELNLSLAPEYTIGTAQAGPKGEKGDPFTGEFPNASETEKGLIMLASQGEVTTGINATKAVVPGTLKPELDKKATDEIASLTLIFNNHLI